MGRKRNREDTIQRLISAVGRILERDGHAGIGVNKVSFEADVSKPMIYSYFGGLNNLLKAYIRQKDYWLPYFEQLELPDLSSKEKLRAFYKQILQDQFRFFYGEREMQKLILWQASEYHPLIRNISETREREGAKLMELGARYFEGSGIDLNALMAILVGGIYYLVLHNSAGSGPVAGIDINEAKDYELTLRTIGQIMDWAWDAAENQGSKS